MIGIWSGLADDEEVNFWCGVETILSSTDGRSDIWHAALVIGILIDIHAPRNGVLGSESRRWYENMKLKRVPKGRDVWVACWLCLIYSDEI